MRHRSLGPSATTELTQVMMLEQKCATDDEQLPVPPNGFPFSTHLPNYPPPSNSLKHPTLPHQPSPLITPPLTPLNQHTTPTDTPASPTDSHVPNRTRNPDHPTNQLPTFRTRKHAPPPPYIPGPSLHPQNGTMMTMRIWFHQHDETMITMND